MSVNRVLGEVSGMFVRDEGMDAKLTEADRTGRRITKVKDDTQGGAIYFITTVGAPFVKIGWVKWPEKLQVRLAQIQTGSPYELLVSGTVRVDSRRAETMMHRKFNEFHFRAEWFRCEGDLKRFVQLVVAFPELSIEQLIEKTS